MPKATLPAEIETLGDAIRYLREKRGLTLRGLAALVEVSPPFLSDIEHNRRGTEKLAALAKELDVDVAELQRLDGRIPRDLEQWIKKNPEVVALLTELRASGREAREVRAMLARRRK